MRKRRSDKSPGRTYALWIEGVHTETTVVLKVRGAAVEYDLTLRRAAKREIGGRTIGRGQKDQKASGDVDTAPDGIGLIYLLYKKRREGTGILMRSFAQS